MLPAQQKNELASAFPGVDPDFLLSFIAYAVENTPENPSDFDFETAMQGFVDQRQKLVNKAFENMDELTDLIYFMLKNNLTFH